MKEVSEDADTSDLSSTGLQRERCWPPFRMVRIASADFLKSRHEARASLSDSLRQGSQPDSAASICEDQNVSSHNPNRLSSEATTMRHESSRVSFGWDLQYQRGLCRFGCISCWQRGASKRRSRQMPLDERSACQQPILHLLLGLAGCGLLLLSGARRGLLAAVRVLLS
jgi:hypothetical protein